MKTKLLVKSLLIAGLLAVVCGYPMQASALPLEEFSFHQHTGFLVDTTLKSNDSNTPYDDIGWYQNTVPKGEGPAPVPAPPGPPSSSQTYNTIAWGVPFTNNGGEVFVNPLFQAPTGNFDTDVSGLYVEGLQGNVTTGAAITGSTWSDWGAWESISTIYHQNRAKNGRDMTNAIFRSDLFFDHVNPGHPNDQIPTEQNDVAIFFNETPNVSPCSGSNPIGSVCDDNFSFFAVTFAPVYFEYGGERYEAEFGLDFDAYDAAHGDIYANPHIDIDPSTGQYIVWTGEDVTSSMDVQVRIREVPEPATLLLLGLGLLGLGFAKRRGIKS